MDFKSFLYSRISAISSFLPQDIIVGIIQKIDYKNNPIKLELRTKNGKKICSFSKRHIYDVFVGKKDPKVGDEVSITIGFGNKIKNIEILR